MGSPVAMVKRDSVPPIRLEWTSDEVKVVQAMVEKCVELSLASLCYQL